MLESTRKWQKKVANLEGQLESMRVSKNIFHDNNLKLQGKLERYEKAEAEDNRANMVSMQKLEDEVAYLRELVRDLTVKPEVITARSKHQLRMQEADYRNQRRREKEMAYQERIWREQQEAKKNKSTL